MTLSVPVSWGELIDKITILEIKRAQIKDEDKLKNIAHELNVLSKVRDNFAPHPAELEHHTKKLQEINQKLWNIEDDIRDHERQRNFGDSFVELARAVYFTNDIRSEIKREINILMGSDLIEEKSYQEYA